MKIIFPLLIAAMFSFSALAQEEQPKNKHDPLQQMLQLIQCHAIDLTLSHLHIQTAASLTALAGPAGLVQLQPIIDNYKSMAVDEQEKTKLIIKLINDVIAPKLLQGGMSKDTIAEGSNKIFNASLQDLARSLAQPNRSFEDQIVIEQALVNQFDLCDTFVSELNASSDL